MPSLRKIAFDLNRISRVIKKGYGLYFPEDWIEFLTDIDKQIGLTPKSKRMLKSDPWWGTIDETYETVRGDKVWVDKGRRIEMEFGGGEYDEYGITVEPAEGYGERFEADLGEDKLWDFFGIRNN